MQAQVQATNCNQETESRRAVPVLKLPVESLAYCCLIAVSLLMRLAALGEAPLSEHEAAQALHALHTLDDDAPGSYSSSHYPLTHITQLISFSLVGASVFSARIGVALAGVALTLTPLLFRGTIGVTRCFIWSLLLSILTLPVAAARTADGATIMMLFAVLAAWMIRRYWYADHLKDAMAAAVFVSCMLLMSSPSALPLALILTVAGAMALWRTALSAPERLDVPGDDLLQLSLRRFKTVPYAHLALTAWSAVFLTGTLFMLNPGGMRAVGALAGQALAGVTEPSNASNLPIGLITLLTREPLLIIFALGGGWLIWRHGAVTFLDRFAAAWSLVALLGLALYPGARASDAMWAALPMSLLASYGITQLMVNRRVAALWAHDDADENASHELYTTRYWHVKWLISLGTMLLLLTASTHFLDLSRALYALPADYTPAYVLERMMAGYQPRLTQALGLLLMTTVASILVYAILASLWGNGTSLQGIGLGFFWFMLLSALGGGWSLSKLGIHDPTGIWHSEAISRDASQLRPTLMNIAKRDAKGFPLIDVVIVEDSGRVSDEAQLAWLMRDFPNSRFVPKPEMAAGEGIIVMAEGAESGVDMGGDYVGQRFVLRRSVAPQGINLWQLPAWWALRRPADAATDDSAVILWLRQDVYDGSGA